MNLNQATDELRTNIPANNITKTTLLAARQYMVDTYRLPLLSDNDLNQAMYMSSGADEFKNTVAHMVRISLRSTI